jgi:hypothetical protein
MFTARSSYAWLSSSKAWSLSPSATYTVANRIFGHLHRADNLLLSSYHNWSVPGGRRKYGVGSEFSRCLTGTRDLASAGLTLECLARAHRRRHSSPQTTAASSKGSPGPPGSCRRYPASGPRR